LLKLNSDNQKLCLIADGSYTHCEKSTYNQFQYNSYSVQKSDNLIKPFVITCSDDYIIDVYGPFKANQNDANIFEYLLNNDIDLNRLIRKIDIIVIDRGFRDNYDFLKKNFIVKMPYCQGLEMNLSDDENDFENGTKKRLNNQLNTKQANHNRVVSKIRFIVEKQIGQT
jgi:hypothetical protein